MEYYAFPAQLCAAYNDIREYGVALPTAQGGALNFTSEFVPLIPLGAPAEVRWVLGDRTIAAFAGKVYLSTSQMMQLVDVNEEQVNKLRALFGVNTSLPGSITAGTRRRPLRTKALEARICYLSTSMIKLVTAQPVDTGASLMLSCEVDYLTLTDLEVEVQQKIVLRRGEYFLRCSVQSGGNENFIALSSYAAKLEKQQG